MRRSAEERRLSRAARMARRQLFRKAVFDMMALLDTLGLKHVARRSHKSIELTSPESPVGLRFGLKCVDPYAERDRDPTAGWKPAVWMPKREKYPGDRKRAYQYGLWQVWRQLYGAGMVKERPPLDPALIETPSQANIARAKARRKAQEWPKERP